MTAPSPERFEILRRLAVAASRGEDLRAVVEKALPQVAELMDLHAAALYLWDADWSVTLAVSHSRSETSGERLARLEEDLLRNLRREHALMSAYLSFGGEHPYRTFTMPLQYENTVFGAIIGVHEGDRRLIDEDAFLEALSATIALQIAAAGVGVDRAAFKDAVDKERLTAILETAVTVNHEINNPLTAILGNVQLLLLHRKDLDEDLANKLKTIEASALRIRDITQRLLRLTSARSTHYAEGTTMLDLGESDSEQPEQ